MTAVETRFAQLHARNPDALRLAELCGFAVRLEPPLLRALRHRFIGGADPSAELDLWHSSLVQTRSASAAIFDGAVHARLREALAVNPRRADALEATRECFNGHSPLQRFEIDLNALPVLDPNVKDAAIERQFAPLVSALRQGGDTAQLAARWLLQAAPRWHPRVRNTGAAWASLIASSALLDGRRIVDGRPPQGMSGERLAQALPSSLAATRQIGIARTRRHLRFLPPDAPDVATVDVPACSPALLLLELDGEVPQVIEARAGEEVPLSTTRPFTLRSLTGEAWRIELTQPKRAPKAQAEPPPAPVVEAEQKAAAPAAEAAQAEAGDEPRKVIILIGGGRRDYFNAVADTLPHKRYDPVMPDHFMGDPKTLPAVQDLLRGARFVVIDASLPQSWLQTWFQALSSAEPIPVVSILHTSEAISEAWGTVEEHPWLVPPLRFESANDLAKHVLDGIVEPAEAMRRSIHASEILRQRRLRVFVASTLTDLAEYRAAAAAAVRRLGDDVIMIEDSAKSESPVERSLEDLARCDVLVCIVGWRYGYVPSDKRLNPDGLSIVELQYNEARRLGKQTLVFVVEAGDTLPPTEDPEDRARAASFRGRVQGLGVITSHLKVMVITSPADLDVIVGNTLAGIRALAVARDVFAREPTRRAETDKAYLETPEQVQAAVDYVLRAAADRRAEPLTGAIARWRSNPSGEVKVDYSRGAAMVSLSDGGLAPFERDDRLKGYEDSNHLFADVLGGTRVRWPIVFFLSERNPPRATSSMNNEAGSIISLGPGYSLLGVTTALDIALEFQGVQLVRPWFIRLLRERGATDDALRALRCFTSLPTAARQFLERQGSSLHGSHAALLHDADFALDAQAVAEALGLRDGDYGELTADARQSFQFRRGEHTDTSFATPSALRDALGKAGVRAVLCNFDGLGLWMQLGANAFELVPTVIVLARTQVVDRLQKVPAFRQFRIEDLSGAQPARQH